MNQATRITVIVIGCLLVLAGVILLARQIGGDEPLQWVGPCALTLLGAGGIILPFVVPAGQVSQGCSDDEDDDRDEDEIPEGKLLDPDH